MGQGELTSSALNFKKKPGKLWTITYLNGARGQIDHNLFRMKWRNSILNTECYNTFSCVGSDHRIVVSKVKLSLRGTC